MLRLTRSAQHVEKQQTLLSPRFQFPPHLQNALPQCPLQQTKTNGIQRTTAAGVIDRDLYRGMSGRVMELSAADPVPTSVQFYLAALLSNSARREICRCFFFSSHKQMHQAKPSQAADGRQCQMRENKNVLFRPKLCIWEGRPFIKRV